MNKVTVRDGEEGREKIGVGSLWKWHNEFIYMLATPSYGEKDTRVVLINLKAGDAGQGNPEIVANPSDLTLDEWEQVCKDSKNYTRIYHVEIKAERGGEDGEEGR